MASVDGFQVPSDDDYDALYQIFNQYCCLGTAREVDEMDNIKFVRFCRDLGIIAHAGGGAGLHVTDVDLLFVTIKPRGRKKLTFDNFCDAVAVMADKLGVTRTDLIRQAIAMDLPQPALTSATRHSMTLSHHVSSSLLASHHTLSSAHSRRLSLPHPAAGHAASAHAASAHVASAHAGYTHAASAHAAPASPAALAPLAAHTSYPLREGRGGRPAAGGASGSAGGFGGGGGGAGDIVPPGDDFPPRLRLIRTRSLEAEEHTRTAAGGFDACRPEPLSELRSSLSDHNSHEGRAMGGREKGERGAEGGQQVGGNGAGRGAGERNENSQGGELYAQRQAVAGGRNNEALGYLHGGEEVVARGGYAQGIANDNDGDSSGVGWTDGAMGRVVVSAVAAAAEESRQGRRGQAGGVVGGGAQQYDDDGNSSTGGRLSNEDPAAAAAEGAVASLMFFDAFRFFSLPHFARHHFVPLAQCGRHQLQGLPPPRMDSIRFIKMCKETAILDARFTTTSADIIFSKVTRGSERKLSVYTLAAALRLIEAEKGLAPPALERIIIAHFLAHVPGAALPPPGANPSSSSPSSDCSSQQQQRRQQQQQRQQLEWMQQSAERQYPPAAGCWAAAPSPAPTSVPSPSPARSSGSSQRSGQGMYARLLQLHQQRFVHEVGGEVGSGYGGFEVVGGGEGQGRVCGRWQSPQPQRRHSMCAMNACYELPHHRTHSTAVEDEKREERREEREGGVGYNGAGWEGTAEQQGSGAGGMVGEVGGGRRNRLVAGGSLACPTLSYH